MESFQSSAQRVGSCWTSCCPRKKENSPACPCCNHTWCRKTQGRLKFILKYSALAFRPHLINEFSWADVPGITWRSSPGLCCGRRRFLSPSWVFNCCAPRTERRCWGAWPLLFMSRGRQKMFWEARGTPAPAPFPQPGRRDPIISDN